MHPFFRKFFGISLVLIAIIGMVFSGMAAAGIWTVRTPVIDSLDETTELLITTLEATSEGLTVVDDSLNAATDTLSATTQTAETMAQTLVEISSLANGIVGLVNLVGGDVDSLEDQNSDFSAEIQSMTNNLSQVTTNMSEAQEVVDAYQVAANNAKIQLENIQQNGPTWITIAVIVLTMMFVWLAIAQVGLLLQGLDLIRRQ